MPALLIHHIDSEAKELLDPVQKQNLVQVTLRRLTVHTLYDSAMACAYYGEP